MNDPSKEVGAGAHQQDARPSTNRRFNQHQNTAGTDKTPGTALQWVPCTRSYPQDRHSQIKRRREAARRLAPWCDRCSARDPLLCRCWNPDPPMSDHAIDAWRAAIERTLPIGPPVVPLEVLQRLYRNTGSDRELALRVWEMSGGEIA
jgi:hypothetical protein